MTEEKKPKVTATFDDNVRELKIEISRYKSLLETLGDRKKAWRAVFIVGVLGTLLFAGIVIVAFTAKRLYPYSDITTNGLGATTIKNEKGEVSYWLYNTAELWANSGISVKAGDILTIHSSGKFNTAIHHLYDSAKDNVKLRDNWVGSEGEEDNRDRGSSSFNRRQYRMFPNYPTGSLVMQVVDNNVPFDNSHDDRNGIKANPENFYAIGSERQNIHIKNAGILYFSLNDIVLNKKTIIGMMYDCLSDTSDECLELVDVNRRAKFESNKNEGNQYLLNPKDNYVEKWDNIKLVNDIFADFKYYFGSKYKNSKSGDRIIGKHKIGVTVLDSVACRKAIEVKNKLNKNDILSKKEIIRLIANRYRSAVIDQDSCIARICELEYYYREEYKTAWFDDNIGSFLIVIEKNPAK